MKTFKELYEACCAACEKRTDIEEVKEPTGDLKKACWKGYTAVGMKMKNGRKVPNCVPANEEVEEIEERNKENAMRRKVMDASRGARYKLDNKVPDREPQHKTAQAHNKAIGRALRSEESELDEARNTYALYDDHPKFQTAHSEIHAAVTNAHKDPKAVVTAMRKHKQVGATDSASRDTIYNRVKRLHGAKVANDTKVLDEEVDQIDELKKTTLMSYKEKNWKSTADAYNKGDDKKVSNRLRGMARASRKLAAAAPLPMRKEETELDEGKGYTIDKDDHEAFTKSEIRKIKNSHFPDMARENLKVAKKSKERQSFLKKIGGKSGGDSNSGSPVGSSSNNMYGEEVEQIDELSKKTLGSYEDKARMDQNDTLSIAHRKYSSPEERAKYKAIADKRGKGRNLALAKLSPNGTRLYSDRTVAKQAKVVAKEDVEQIDELSKGTLRKYGDAAHEQESDIRYTLKRTEKSKHISAGAKDELRKLADRRKAGIKLAADKRGYYKGTDAKYNFTHGDAKVHATEEVEIDEAAPHGMSDREYARHELGKAKKPEVKVGAKVSVTGGGSGVVQKIYDKELHNGQKRKFIHLKDRQGRDFHHRYYAHRVRVLEEVEQTDEGIKDTLKKFATKASVAVATSRANPVTYGIRKGLGQSHDEFKKNVKYAAGIEEEQIDEQAPVAPTLDRKYLKGTPEHKAYKASKVRQKFRLVYKDGKLSVKEESELDEGKDPMVSNWKNSVSKRIKRASPEHQTKLNAHLQKAKSASDFEQIHQKLDKLGIKEETDRNQRLRDALAKVEKDFTKSHADQTSSSKAPTQSAPKPKTGGGMPYYPDSHGGRRYMGDSVEMDGEQIDELSKDTLASYNRKAWDDRQANQHKTAELSKKPLLYRGKTYTKDERDDAEKTHNELRKLAHRHGTRTKGIETSEKKWMAKEEVEQIEEAKHRVNVTVSDPNHSAVSKRTETTQKFVRLSAADEKSAVEKAKAHYKGKGYKVHSAEHAGMVSEAVYQGKKVPLNKPMAGDVKKSKVYVDPDGDGTAQKVNFGDKNMTIKKNIPARRKSFRARHNCENPGPKTKARYWSCKAW